MIFARRLCNAVRVFGPQSGSSGLVDSDISRTLSRYVRELVQKCVLSEKYCELGDDASHKELLKILKKCNDSNELTSRVAAFSVALSTKLGRYDDAWTVMPRTEYCPPVLVRSLKVQLLAKEGRLDEAIDQLEEVLNEEDSLFRSSNHCISEEALDELYKTISARTDTSNSMKRFRSLQRILTSFSRRTPLTIHQLLHTPIAVPSKLVEDVPEITLTDKIIEQTPHFLSEKQ